MGKWCVLRLTRVQDIRSTLPAWRCGLSIHKTSELGIKRYGDDEVSSVNDSITSFLLESMDGKVSVRVNSRVSESSATLDGDHSQVNRRSWQVTRA